MPPDNTPNTLQLAKQGDPKAIASLINRQLQPRGITTKASLKDGCLQIMLESASVPKQQVMVTGLRKLIASFDVESIQKVKVYGKQIGEEFPDWNEEFEIDRKTTSTSIAASEAISQVSPLPVPEPSATEVNIPSSELNIDPALKELAKQGDVKAISSLISNQLQRNDLVVRVSLRNGLLQVVLVSSNVPSQQTTVPIIQDLLTVVESNLINKVKVIGMQELEGSANSNVLWNKEFTIEIQEKGSNQVEEELQIEYSNQVELTDYEALFDPEITPLQNLHTNLAEIAIEELAKVDARLSVSVILKDFPSVVAPAVFAVNQFMDSEDSKVAEYLSSNLRITSFLYQTLQECFQLKLNRLNNSWTRYVDEINGNSELGKYIELVLPEEPKTWSGSYSYKQVTQSIMSKASENLIDLNKLLQTMRQISRDRDTRSHQAVNTLDPFEQIGKLKKLKDEGILSESEFEAKKKEILERI